MFVFDYAIPPLPCLLAAQALALDTLSSCHLNHAWTRICALASVHACYKVCHVTWPLSLASSAGLFCALSSSVDSTASFASLVSIRLFTPRLRGERCHRQPCQLLCLSPLVSVHVHVWMFATMPLRLASAARLLLGLHRPVHQFNGFWYQCSVSSTGPAVFPLDYLLFSNPPYSLWLIYFSTSRTSRLAPFQQHSLLGPP